MTVKKKFTMWKTGYMAQFFNVEREVLSNCFIGGLLGTRQTSVFLPFPGSSGCRKPNNPAIHPSSNHLVLII